MIDIENEVFTAIATKARAKFKGLYMTGEYVASPPQFPCVSLIEMDNAVYRRTMDSSMDENYSSVMYELNVFSNKKGTKKSECRKIAAFIDGELRKMGFVRRFLNPIPNVADSTIYRLTGRYSAVISKDKVIYRR